MHPHIGMQDKMLFHTLKFMSLLETSLSSAARDMMQLSMSRQLSDELHMLLSMFWPPHDN